MRPGSRAPGRDPRRGHRQRRRPADHDQRVPDGYVWQDPLFSPDGTKVLVHQFIQNTTRSRRWRVIDVLDGSVTTMGPTTRESAAGHGAFSHRTGPRILATYPDDKHDLDVRRRTSGNGHVGSDLGHQRSDLAAPGSLSRTRSRRGSPTCGPRRTSPTPGTPQRARTDPSALGDFSTRSVHDRDRRWYCPPTSRRSSVGRIGGCPTRRAVEQPSPCLPNRPPPTYADQPSRSPWVAQLAPDGPPRPLEADARDRRRDRRRRHRRRRDGLLRPARHADSGCC